MFMDALHDLERVMLTGEAMIEAFELNIKHHNAKAVFHCQYCTIYIVPTGEDGNGKFSSTVYKGDGVNFNFAFGKDYTNVLSNTLDTMQSDHGMPPETKLFGMGFGSKIDIDLDIAKKYQEAGKDANRECRFFLIGSNDRFKIMGGYVDDQPKENDQEQHSQFNDG